MDRELFCLCYDPKDLNSFFFIISLFYELFEDHDASSIVVPPLFLVAQSQSSSSPAVPTSALRSSSDCRVSTREGKMLASILCCPFFSISTDQPSDDPHPALQHLFHTMAREVRLSREGFATRFHKAGHVASPVSGRSMLRENHDCARVVVVQDDLYLGQVRERTKDRNGVGVAWMKATREIYMGEWRDDKPHGWGVLYSPSEGRRQWAGSWMGGRALSSAVDLTLEVAPSSPPPTRLSDGRRSK